MLFDFLHESTTQLGSSLPSLDSGIKTTACLRVVGDLIHEASWNFLNYKYLYSDRINEVFTVYKYYHGCKTVRSLGLKVDL